MNLRRWADGISELGHGGKSSADLLLRLARQVPPGQAVVDIAPWMGSTSAYLALGIIEGGRGNVLHAYDLWETDEIYREKARRFQGIDLPLGTDVSEIWRRNISPFGVRYVMHKGSIDRAEWPGGDIGLIVDDISNTADLIVNMMRKFAAHLVPGGRLVLMDWGFHEKRHWPYQKDFMDRNARAFGMVDRAPPPSEAAVFERLGEGIYFPSETE